MFNIYKDSNLKHTWNRLFSAWPLCFLALPRRVLYSFPSPTPFSAEQMTLFGSYDSANRVILKNLGH